jgi:hypothetical protein
MIWLDGAGHMLPPQTTRVADFLARARMKIEPSSHVAHVVGA